MHFQFLIEDQSGKALVDAVMEKVIAQFDTVTYDGKFFKGIGGFTKRNTVKATKSGKLLNDLATYLRGFNKSLRDFAAALIIVLDNDDRDTAAFRAELEEVAAINNISVDYVFCIAVEEMEAWLLGDESALLCAYPRAKLAILRAYCQDSICGTWECLADAIYQGGSDKMKKTCSPNEIGKNKSDWALNIGKYMNIHNNKSPSFNHFIGEIIKRAQLSA